jgi:hypothetical protein
MIRSPDAGEPRPSGRAGLDAYPESWKRVALSNDPAAFARLLDAVAEARRLQLSQVTWQVVERLLLRLMEENHRWST